MADNGTQPIAPPLDQLSQLLMSIPKAGSPADGWAPPMALPSPQTSSTPVSSSQSGAVVSPQPATAAAPPIQTVSPTPPSDDPALASARAGMNSSQTALTKGLSDYSDTRGKMAAIPAVNPADYKPHWYDRLLGGLVGTAAGIGDPARGAEVGANVTHRGLINAQNSRASQIQPLLEQLNAEREEVPMLNAANESANRQVQSIQNDRKIAETERKDQALEGLRADVNDLHAKAQTDKQADFKDKLDQMQKKFDSDANLRQQMLSNQGDAIDMRGKIADLQNQIREKALDQKAAQVKQVTDTRTLDKQEAEDVAGIEKKYSGAGGLWYRVTGNREKELADTHALYAGKRAELGVGPTGQPAGPAGAGGANPPGATHIVNDKSGKRIGTVVNGKYVADQK